QRATAAQLSSLRLTAAKLSLREAWGFEMALELEIWSFRLQADRMSCVNPARRTINGLQSRCPFAAVTVVWRCIEPLDGNHSERVTFSCVDGDPFARTAVAVIAKLR